MADERYPINGNDTPSYIGEHFSKAIKDVIYTMTGVEIDEIKSVPEEMNRCSGQISGVMVLIGKKNGLLTITMSKETALNLVSYMTGISVGKLRDEELYDGIAELVNMIAGQAKAFLTGTEYHFSLTVPFAIIGENHFIVHKCRVANFSKEFKADNNDFELFAKVYYM